MKAGYPPLSEILAVVAEIFRVTVRDIKGRRRFQSLVLARHVALWLGRTLTPASFPMLGQQCGGLDHATVIAACRRVARLLATDPVLRETILGLRDRIAVKIPDELGVSRSMRLSFMAEPPRVVVEIKGEQPFELAGYMTLTKAFDGYAHGEVWVVVPAAAAAAWARIAAPVWHDLSVQVDEDAFRCGRVLMAFIVSTITPEIRAKLGEGEAVSLSALVQFDAVDEHREGQT